MKSKFLASSEELIPLALSARPLHPRNSPLSSGNEPVLAAVGLHCASHHFSTRELLLGFCIPALLCFQIPIKFLPPSFMGGSVHHKNSPEREESGFCRALGLQQPRSH